MANVFDSFFYGINFMEYVEGVQGVSMQLHITAKCDQNCKHCYMYNSPHYLSQIQNEMDKETFFLLIDEYFSLQEEYNSHGFIAITGGDPILSPYFWDILEYINKNYSEKAEVVILGNPYHISHQVAIRMKKLNVYRYQISIDGLRETHDCLRKKGSYDDSLRALKVLHEAEIKTVVSYTLSKKNENDFLPLFDEIKKMDFVDDFGFDRMIPTGNGKNLKEELFSPEEFRAFLFKAFKHEIFSSNGMIIAKKEEMWRVFLDEMGLINPIENRQEKHFCTGCGCGTETFSVLADGTFKPCIKLEWSAGKYPDKKLKDLFINNDVTKAFRQHNQFKGCNTCEANSICRGCPAMKYAVTGDFYGYEPYCWRSHNAK